MLKCFVTFRCGIYFVSFVSVVKKMLKLLLVLRFLSVRSGYETIQKGIFPIMFFNSLTNLFASFFTTGGELFFGLIVRESRALSCFVKSENELFLKDCADQHLFQK